VVSRPLGKVFGRPQFLSPACGISHQFRAHRDRAERKLDIRPLARDEKLTRRRQRPQPVLLTPAAETPAPTTPHQQRTLGGTFVRVPCDGAGRPCCPGSSESGEHAETVNAGLSSVGELHAESPHSRSRLRLWLRGLTPSKGHLEHGAVGVNLRPGDPHRHASGVDEQDLQRGDARHDVLSRCAPLRRSIALDCRSRSLRRWGIEEAQLQNPTVQPTGFGNRDHRENRQPARSSRRVRSIVRA
jgi:hypothetical protein